MDPSSGQKQIKLTVYDNEPMARLAQQRLQQEDISCMVRSLGAGPGGWGVETYLPHGLYVKVSDEMQARDILDLPPEEIAEREPDSTTQPPRMNTILVLAVVVVVAVFLLANLEFAIR